MRAAGIAFIFLWFFLGGIAHFAATDLELRIVPHWVPWPRETVWITGVLELLGACALLRRRLRALAGLGLSLLTIAVTPANVYMLQHSESFNVPLWVLVLRLPVQVALLLLIVWSTGAVDVIRRP